ncbi:MAG: hypothetical protein JW943_17605 [Deltaproteobacteria bacterium]|nr:hypothetical protein [Deltaproteobacteria bacterium]
MEKQFGYAGTILRVNLTTGRIDKIPTAQYADRFIGGRGMAAKIYWDLVPPDVDALDPRNCLIFVTGPVAGFAGLSGSRWQVCAKSPSTHPQYFSYSNLGGHWGAQLKFAGYDGLICEGAADKPVYIEINDGDVMIHDASRLWQKTAAEVIQAVKIDLGRHFRVVATGPSGDHQVAFAGLTADGDACGSSGMGAVMGSKKLKAIAVHGGGRIEAARPEKLSELVAYVRDLRKLKPGQLEKLMPEGSRLKREACFGCIGACTGRLVYTALDGTKGKSMCQSSVFYMRPAWKYHGRQTEVPFFANRICDAYGLDTMVVDSIIVLLQRCAKAGILTEENTGLPLSRIGSLEFIETLARMIAFREGIGDVLARGTTKAAEMIGNGAPELIADYLAIADHPPAYCPRMYISTGLFYAMEPRQPIQQLHAVSRLLLQWVSRQSGNQGSHVTSDLVRRISKTFWGSEEGCDFTTYAGKALAAKNIQDREYVKESLILCDFAWPVTDVGVADEGDHFGDPALESRIYSAVTGRDVDEAGLNALGERIFNLQRAILTREGHAGREADRIAEIFYTVPLKDAFLNPECLATGKNGEPVSRKGAVVDREQFEAMKTEYYNLRKWDAATGLQSKSRLEDVGLSDIVREMDSRFLVDT